MNTRLSILLVLVATLTASLSACNTVKGIGQDIQKAGEVLEDAAAKKK